MRDKAVAEMEEERRERGQESERMPDECQERG